MTGQQLRFYFVDVFAHEPLSGNPLSLVVDAQDLSQETMQRVAREFNQSETTFLLPPTRPGADWRLRSFTPTGVEVWGAGHNALGAWWWLAEAGRLTLSGPRTVFQQEIGEQVLPVEVLAEEGKEGEQWRPTAIGMTQTAPIFGAIHTDAAALAAALALESVDLAVEGFPVQVVSTGSRICWCHCATVKQCSALSQKRVASTNNFARLMPRVAICLALTLSIRLPRPIHASSIPRWESPKIPPQGALPDP